MRGGGAGHDEPPPRRAGVDPGAARALGARGRARAARRSGGDRRARGRGRPLDRRAGPARRASASARTCPPLVATSAACSAEPSGGGARSATRGWANGKDRPAPAHSRRRSTTSGRPLVTSEASRRRRCRSTRWARATTTASGTGANGGATTASATTAPAIQTRVAGRGQPSGRVTIASIVRRSTARGPDGVGAGGGAVARRLRPDGRRRGAAAARTSTPVSDPTSSAGPVTTSRPRSGTSRLRPRRRGPGPPGGRPRRGGW